MEKLRVFEAFAGYGSQSLALRNLGIPYEVVAISEIDKYAIQAYNVLHGDTLNLGDISKIEPSNIPDHDLFTYSFPCQDISNAGKQRGFEKGSGTRSGLLWECEKVIKSKKPKYLLMENVKNLVGKKFKQGFDEWGEWLESQGYTNFYQVLNAKDYGVPQNRERVFMISILNGDTYEFPKILPLNATLRDFLDDEVNEKFNLSDEYMSRFIASTKTDKYPMGNAYKVLGSTVGTGQGTNSRHWVYDIDDCMSTLDATMYKQPKQILIREATKLGHKGAIVGDSVNLEQPNSKTRRGRVGNQIANTLVTSCNQGVVTEDMKIRKLTPTECFRLMGLKEDDIEKLIHSGISDTQLYKLAGNSIVVDVLEHIFRELLTK